MLVVGVYIPNSAPGAVSTLTNHILALENKYTDSLVIMLGDFNQTSLTKEMRRYKQQVKYPTHVKKQYSRPLLFDYKRFLGQQQKNVVPVIPPTIYFGT